MLNLIIVGCAVLSLLALKGLEPNEANIKANINSNADCTWSGYNGSTVSYPYIAKVGSSHFVIVENSEGIVWDPNGGKASQISQYSITGRHYKG